MSRSVVLALFRALLLVLLPALVAPASMADSATSWAVVHRADDQPSVQLADVRAASETTSGGAGTVVRADASAAQDAEVVGGAPGQSLSRSAPPSESTGAVPVADDPPAWTTFHELPSPPALASAVQRSGPDARAVDSAVVHGRAPPSGTST